MVDGKFVMRAKEIIGVDEEKILEKASGIAHDLVSR